MNKTPNKSLNAAFTRINSAVGEELEEIVRIIEKHGRKKRKNKRALKSKKKRVLEMAV